MHVARIDKADGRNVQTERPSQEQLQREFNYLQAERISQKLLEKGLISIVEFDRIMDENRRVCIR